VAIMNKKIKQLTIAAGIAFTISIMIEYALVYGYSTFFFGHLLLLVKSKILKYAGIYIVFLTIVIWRETRKKNREKTAP
jgi:hypothetical protein